MVQESRVTGRSATQLRSCHWIQKASCRATRAISTSLRAARGANVCRSLNASGIHASPPWRKASSRTTSLRSCSRPPRSSRWPTSSRNAPRAVRPRSRPWTNSNGSSTHSRTTSARIATNWCLTRTRAAQAEASAQRVICCATSRRLHPQPRPRAVRHRGQGLGPAHRLARDERAHAARPNRSR